MVGDLEGTQAAMLLRSRRVAVMVVAAGNRGGRARYRARCTRGGHDVTLKRQCTAWTNGIAQWLVGQGRKEGRVWVTCAVN